MLTSLSIKNYALIESLDVDFNNGFTIITGETGAGKSILLGGLGLILGKRADLSSLRDTDKKCIIEANFDITNYNLETLFKAEDLDFEPQTIIRREILPSGKSRAFVNEFQVIDALSGNAEHLESYRKELSKYKSLQKELADLKQFQNEAIKEQDYNVFLLNELVEANLNESDIEKLEAEYETLNNVEFIQLKLTEANQLLSEEQSGVLTTLTEVKNTLQKLASISKSYNDVFQRVNSSLIELDDVFNEVERIG